TKRPRRWVVERLYWLLESSFQKQARQDRERSTSLHTNRGWSVENQMSSKASSCLDNAIFMEWRSFLDGWCCDTSPAPLGWLLGGSRLLLFSLDKTVQDLLAARNPHRSWERQIPAHRRKRPLAPAIC